MNSILVFIVYIYTMNNIFKITDTEYINPPNEYLSESTYPDFQEKLDFLKKVL